MSNNAQSRSRRNPDLWNRMVNDKFNGQQPVLSGEESIAAAKKLYRHAMGKPWPGKWELTSGRRMTWPRWRDAGSKMEHVFYVNPDERRSRNCGLREIIHSISHYCHRRLHPKDKPHSIRQARLEAKLAKFALDRGCWMDGSLKRQPKPEPEVEKAKPDVVAQRHARMVARRLKWQQELERAQRLLAKAERDVRTYERRHRARLNVS